MAPEPRPRVFLDSNVVFSGLHSPQGAPGVILDHFASGILNVAVSQQVLEEVVRTIKRKLPEALPALKTLLVNAPLEVVADPGPAEMERWRGKLSAGDAAVLAAAVAARPDYLVTGDRHFLANPGVLEETGLRVMTPAELLGLLERGET